MGSVAYSLIDNENFIKYTTQLNNFILDRFGWLYSLSAFLFLVIIVWIYFSKLATVRIGGKDAQPILTKWRWFTITICTTIAIGILFWGTSEPLYHLHSPPKGLDIEPNSIASMRFAMSTLFMHWTLIPYAIYTAAGLLFALVYYNLKRPFSLGSLLYPLFGNAANRGIGNVIDAISLYSLVAGMSAVLGTGILTISGGLNLLFGIENSHFLYFLITFIIVATFVLSAISGLMKGIRLLSDWNIKFFFALAFFVFICGPTLFILKIGVESMGEFFQTFFQRSLYVCLDPSDDWAASWTIFYWANWMAWTPITALFLGRLAVGYTVRDFIHFNLIFPSLFSAFWMMIFGGTSLHLDFFNEGSPIYTLLQQEGMEMVIFSVLGELPFSKIVSFFFLFIVFLSYVTASDSNTSAMSGLSSMGISPESPEPSMLIKLIWGGTIGAVALIMILNAGVDGVKMISNLGGFPALFFLILVGISLVQLGRFPSKLG
jgi:choline-glycine betaine transporter